MIRYLNPKNDLVFKKIFGEHPDILKSFLNAILPLKQDALIESLTYLPADHVPEIPGFKYTLVDVRCCDVNGRTFIVEMQMNWSKHFIQRMIFNTSATYVKQLNRGDDYEKLCPVYGVAIVDDNFTDDLIGVDEVPNQGMDINSEWFHHYQLMNPQNPRRTLNDIQLVFLELPKFKPNTRMEKKLAALWMRYMTEINENTQEVDPTLFDDPFVMKALKLVEEAAYTRAELLTYDRSWDAISSEKTIMSDKYDAGLERGLSEGEAKGRIEGEMQGRYAVAKNLLKAGLSIDSVSEHTGLTIKELQKYCTN